MLNGVLDSTKEAVHHSSHQDFSNSSLPAPIPPSGISSSSSPTSSKKNPLAIAQLQSEPLCLKDLKDVSRPIPHIPHRSARIPLISPSSTGSHLRAWWFSPLSNEKE